MRAAGAAVTGVAYKEYDDPILREVRKRRWDAASDAHGRPCAQETLYLSRQLPDDVSAVVKKHVTTIANVDYRTPAFKRKSGAFSDEADELPEEGSPELAQPVPARACKPGQRKTRHSTNVVQRDLRDADSLYLMLTCIREGVFPHKKAYSFGIKPKTAARYFKTEVRVWAEILKREFPRPTQEEVFRSVRPLR